MWAREPGRVVPDLSPEDLASAAREIGIAWGRGTVRAIETGERKIWAIEFLLLGEIFRRAWERKGLDTMPVLQDLLPEARFTVGSVWVDGRGLTEVIHGRPLPEHYLGQLRPEIGEMPGAGRLEPRKVLPDGDLPPGLDLRTLGMESRGDAEVRLARKLGVDPEAVVIAAHRAWGVGLATKRDRGLGYGTRLKATSIQRKRGRVTLQLGEEIAEEARAVQERLIDRSPPP